MNFVALLAVLAATSFVLPLLVQGCEALGLARSASVAVSLVLALGAVLAWGVRTWRATAEARRGAAFRSGPRERRRGGRGVASGGVVDAAAARLVEAEEESRAGV